MTNECKHGRLARKCELCELEKAEATNRALIEALEELTYSIMQIIPHISLPIGAVTHTRIRNDIERAGNALTQAKDINGDKPALKEMCLAQSDNQCLCTRERGHGGEHIAKTCRGETADRWPREN